MQGAESTASICCKEGAVGVVNGHNELSRVIVSWRRRAKGRPHGKTAIAIFREWRDGGRRARR